VSFPVAAGVRMLRFDLAETAAAGLRQ